VNGAGEMEHERLVEFNRNLRLAQLSGGTDSWTAGYWTGRIDEFAAQNATTAEGLADAALEARTIRGL
jgi:hypothetical protein